MTKTTPPTFGELLALVDRLASMVERIADGVCMEMEAATRIAMDAAELRRRNDDA